MKFSFFNFFRDEKHNLIIIALDIRNIPGGYDLFDRILLIIIADILILLFLFICEYIFYRVALATYIFTRGKPFSLKKKPYSFHKDRQNIKQCNTELPVRIRYRFDGFAVNKRMQRRLCYYTRN